MNDLTLSLFLADDDQDDRMLFQEALLNLSYDIVVRTFDNGVDLMGALLENEVALPHIIFLDLNMPLMNGIECLDDIKNEPSLTTIPIVIYSSFIDNEKIALLHDKGANRFLQKPNTFPRLQLMLEQVILSIITMNANKNCVAS
jgi:CheY-like chemotaxis protein